MTTKYISSLPEQIRFTLRRLRRAPSYSLVAVGLLGLGLGVVAATFTVLSQVVLHPLPVSDQDNIVVAWTNHTVRGFDHFPVTAPLFEAADNGGAPALASVGAVGSFGTSRVIVEGNDGPIPQAWTSVLGDFFGVLGVEPILGRTLLPSDDVPNPVERIAVISHGLWVRLYGSAPEVLGAKLRTKFGSHTIVGVLPSDFDYPRGAEVWTSMRPGYPAWESELPLLELDLVARLGPDASREMVFGQLASLMRSTPELRNLYDGAVPVVRSFEDHVLGDLGSTLMILFAGGVLVLVVASLDLANIVLIRTVGERRHTAVRRALGMDPRWVLNEAAIEAALFAVAATGLGVFVGNVGVRLLVPFAPADVTRLDLVQGLDALAYPLLALAATVAVSASVVLPRSTVGRTHGDHSLLRSSAPTATRLGNWLREGVVAGQVAIAVWVLVTGALLVRTVDNLQSLDEGFDPNNLALVTLDHAEGGNRMPPAEDQLLSAAVLRIEQTNGILGVSPIQMAPLPGNGAWQTILFLEGQTNEQARTDNPFVFMEFVEPNFTTVMDVPILRGRDFADSDDLSASPVLLVNQAAARLYWPSEEVIGQSVRTRFPGYEDRPFSVIGVIGDTRYGDLTELKPTVYFSRRQVHTFRPQYLLARTTGSGAPVLNVVRDALRAEAPQYRAVGVTRVSDHLDEPLVRPRFAALLLSVLALAALSIAAAGIYTTMVFLVRTRRRELGIRMACGGAPVDIGAMVVRRGLTIGLFGSLVGGLAAIASARLFGSLLYGVAGFDARSLIAGIGLALVCTTVACVSPALRAAGTDPANVLRLE